MVHYTYSESPYLIRAGLGEAYRQYWQALANPGTWFTGAERVAIAAEVRNALDCPFCVERKNALSPYAVKGEHNSGDTLNPAVVDAVHRVITDQSRITGAFIEELAAQGVTEEHYVELVGIAVTVLSIDEFNRALGLPLEPLPASLPGKPSNHRPAVTECDTGFVAMVTPDGAVGEESDLWKKGRTANVLRALSLVPNAVREWMAVGDQQYLSMAGMGQFGDFPDRSINRMQIELIAGRVSSINECFY